MRNTGKTFFNFENYPVAQHTLILDRNFVSLDSISCELTAASFAHEQSTSAFKLEIAQNKKKDLLINILFLTFLFGLGTRLRRAYECF